MKRMFCVNCGEEIDGDDQGDWIHVRTTSHICDLVLQADPGEGSYG